MFTGIKSIWRGFKRYDFKLKGIDCIVVEPQNPLAGKPWLWRARFFDVYPEVDEAMVKAGYHLAYIDVTDLFGGPEAIRRFDMFYEYLTERYHFNTKVALEGFSRGGLVIYRWATLNTKKVACIYADAPVCDFKSWPGRNGIGRRENKLWNSCLAAYGLTEAEAIKFKSQPIDTLAAIADAKIPILHVCGDIDDIVPIHENTEILEARYKALGGKITVIHKPDCGHHPHGLKDPSPIIDFLKRHYNPQICKTQGLLNYEKVFSYSRQSGQYP